MASPARAKAGAAVAFGDLDMYVAGGGLPEGDYIIKDASVVMYQAPANQSTGQQSPARLGVMLTMIPYREGKGGVEYDEEKTQFYSMGSKAHESFQPNPETGKGVVAVPGGPASNFNSSTNWAIFLKSLHDSGMPKGTFIDDSSVLEGMWVHMSNIPEPAERASFQSNMTGEVAADRKPKTIAVVSEIKDDGKPWEGSGGVPEVDAPAAPVKAAKAAPKAAAPKVAPKAAAKAAPAPAADEGDEATQASAISAISAVMEKNPKGCKKLQLRTGVFKYLNDNESAEAAQGVISTYFADDATLGILLGELGYAMKGMDVVAA